MSESVSLAARAAMQNALALISDPTGGRLPEHLAGLITATESCLAVGCRNPDDAETEFVLGRAAEFAECGEPTFSGVVATPSRRLAVRSVGHETIVAIATASESTLVRIWVDHPQEPDRIVIAVG